MKQLAFPFLFQLLSLTVLAQNGTTEAFSKSYHFENNKQYLKAITALEGVYAANSYPLNLRLGWLHYLKGDYVVAQSFYKKAIGIKPHSIEARLGYVYPTAAMENWNDVVSTYEEILEIDPNHSVVNFRMATIFFYRKEYEKAKGFAQKVLILYPFDFDTNYLLAQIELSLGNIIEAKAALKNCLQYNPSSMEVQNIWAQLKG